MIELLSAGMVASSGAAVVACASDHRVTRAASEVIMLAAMLDCVLFGAVPRVLWAVLLIAAGVASSIAVRGRAHASDAVHSVSLVAAAGLVMLAGHQSSLGHHALGASALALVGLAGAGVLVIAASVVPTTSSRDRFGAVATTVGVALMAVHGVVTMDTI